MSILPELEALQEVIAEHIIARGVTRVITQEILQQLVRDLLAADKKVVEGLGPEENPEDSKFTPMATILTASGYEADVHVGWPKGEKRQRMHALSETCRVTLAQGVIFRNVVTTVNTDEIAPRMGLNHPDITQPGFRQKMDYFESRMFRWIEQNYGKQRLASLPTELRHDGLVVCGMGPKLKEYGQMSVYKWRDGKIEWEDFGDKGHMMMVLIPRWWQ